MDFKVFTCSLLLTSTVYGYSNPCCQSANNTIVKKKCSDGSPIKVLSCRFKYIVSMDEGRIDENNNLNIGLSQLPPDQYCDAKFNDSDVLLVCFNEEVMVASSSIFTVYAILELVSVFFILLTIFVYFQIRDLLDLQGVCIMHAICGLAFSFLVLAVNQLTNEKLERYLCIGFAYVIYITMLYSFFWLNILAFHIWRTIVKPGSFPIFRHHWKSVYYAVGCGGPTLLTIVLIMAHSMEASELHPGFGETKCWFKTTKSQFIYFYAPLAILLCLNIIYYGWTVAVLWRQVANTDERKSKILKYRLQLCLKLFIIMGISWIFELLSASFDSFIWYVTDTFNTLQGVLIFLILVVFRKRVIRGLADRNICGVRLPGRWRTVADEECDEYEEEFKLSEAR